MADDCAALVRHLQLPSVDLVGHSMGGMIAQECAIRHAALFDLLFPIATSAAFAKAIPHASFDAIEGAAHSFPVELPQEFTRRVLAFLKAPSPR